nr:glycosyltransferase family 2 protein [Mesorhizobium loti]
MPVAGCYKTLAQFLIRLSKHFDGSYVMNVPHVAILMATYNGEHFLQQQLTSIAAQTYRNLSLWISDDGSTDSTLQIVAAFRAKHLWLPVHVLPGPQAGFVRNFLSMVCDRQIGADFFAFCDQDDVWRHDKVAAAIACLSTVPSKLPAVYVSRTRTIDKDGTCRGTSPLFELPPTVHNALVQSIGGGNTMVFNSQARRLLEIAGSDVAVPSHDWWTYLVVTACGGFAFYDPEPRVDYRQHGENIIGENGSLAARLFRLNLLLKGRFRHWITANIEALSRLGASITPQNRKLIAEFEKVRHARSAVQRVTGIKRLGIHRQTQFGNISLHLAAVLGKL